MIGTKITKPVDDWQPYQEAAVWCNENKAVIEDKGEWYEVVALPEPTIHELKTRKLADLNSAFETASQTAHCVSSAGFEINADETANRNVSSLIIAMEATGQQTARFCAYDNTFHTVTLEQLKTMQLEIIAHAQGIYERKWVLREAIEAAQTQEELDDVVITFDPIQASSGEPS